jgi:hypothetical protein
MKDSLQYLMGCPHCVKLDICSGGITNAIKLVVLSQIHHTDLYKDKMKWPVTENGKYETLGIFERYED